MNQSNSIIVLGRDGLTGTIERSSWPPRAGESQVAVRLSGGEQILVPIETLVLQSDGSYFLPLGYADVQQHLNTRGYQAGETMVVPIIVEELDVQRRLVETGRVRVNKLVREHQETIEEPLIREQVVVERRAVNQLLNEPVSVRYEGDTMIVPVLEEVLVVEKRLVLKEEILITKQRTEQRESQTVTLRSEEVTVERVDGAGYSTVDGTDIA